MGELLYNGIELGEQWPPRYRVDELTSANKNPPYLRKSPQVFPVDLGRQLFVDDFLIEETDCTRVFEKPKIHPASPVFKPETTEEMDNGNCPMAAPFNDGCWYDPHDGLFKLWYMPGWFHTMALAVSRDGIYFERPVFDVVPGTNLVWPPQPYYERDGALVWLDNESPDTASRYKMFQFYRFGKQGETGKPFEGWLQTSPDGIHWSIPTVTTSVGDNSSFFYNPFRKKWCMSIRRGISMENTKGLPYGLRARFYHEADDFLSGAQWDPQNDESLWQLTDSIDKPDPRFPEHPVALYDLNVTPYESLMVGLFAVFRGPENNICEEMGIPKTIDLELGFSRDGFHFTRPERTPFLAASRKEGDWNRAYLHAAGGLCLVVNDELRFYFTGFSGKSPKLGPYDMGSSGRMRRLMYAGASTGLATLRRDGFAAMTAKGSGHLKTYPLIFSGNYLFINAYCGDGEVKAELLYENGCIIPGYEKENCLPFKGDSTKVQLKWKNKKTLALLAGKPVVIKFYLAETKLYSFWVSRDEKGASGGYVAAGGPGFTGSRDL